jgi:hypothetical protein
MAAGGIAALKLNQSKNSKIGERQLDLARRLHEAGMLSQGGLYASRHADYSTGPT